MRIGRVDVIEDASHCPPGARSARWRAVLALALFVALVAAGHWVLSEADDRELDQAAQILSVQRLGTDCERIAKLSLALQSAEAGPARDWLAAELKQLLISWDRSFDALRASSARGAAVRESRAVRAMFVELQTAQWGVLSAGREMVKLARAQRADPSDVRRNIDEILRAERHFLDSVNGMIIQLRRESAERVSTGKLGSRVWLIVVVSALAIGAWLTLRVTFGPLDWAGREIGLLRQELQRTRHLAGTVSADYKRLARVLGNELRPSLAEMLAACHHAAEFNAQAASNELLRIDTIGRRLMRRLTELLPATTASGRPATTIRHRADCPSSLLDVPSVEQERELDSCGSAQNR